MKGRASSWPRVSIVVASGIVLLALWLVAAPPAEAKKRAPINRYYFVVVMGFEADYDVSAECFLFKKGRMKLVTEQNMGGTWQFTEREEGESGLHMEGSMMIELGGVPIQVEIDSDSRIDDRGPGSAFAGPGRLYVPAFDAVSNFAGAGREVKKKKQCVRMARDFNRIMGVED